MLADVIHHRHHPKKLLHGIFVHRPSYILEVLEARHDTMFALGS
jgi:hypothetical protein